MVKKLFTLLMLFVAAVNVTIAAGTTCDAQQLQRAAVCVSEEGKAISNVGVHIVPQHIQDSNRSNSERHPRPNFHYCHFGHCSVIVTFTKFAPFASYSKYDFDLKNPALKSFIVNLFRPPIA